MTRTCACPHGFPLCCCALGVAGDELLDRSRLASDHAGWPGPLEADLVVVHDARMDRAKRQAAERAEAVRRRRAAKPRVPLGTRPRVPLIDGGDCGCGK